MFKGKVIIALQILQYMRTKGDLVVLENVARAINISDSYAEQLFSVLRKSGLVKGIRGPGGGYFLETTKKGALMFEDVTLIDFSELFYPDDNNDVLSKWFSGLTLDEVVA